jgi:hypothetical protein
MGCGAAVRGGAGDVHQRESEHNLQIRAAATS